MKSGEKERLLKENHFTEWMKTYKEIENELSNKQTLFCVCGKLATGLHEGNCRKFRKQVNTETIKKLQHLL